MRICRFQETGSQTSRFGLIDGNKIFPFSAATDFESLQSAQPEGEISIEQVNLLAPVAPSKIVCVGRNYAEHAAELGNKMPDEPLLFLKAPSAVIGNGGKIELPRDSQQVEHEGELGVVIGRPARNLTSADNPLDYVLGYTCANDVTARDLQRKDVQFTRGKSFDTFCPVGPYIVTGIDPVDVEVMTRVNGQVRQQGRTSDMAFPVEFLIRYISRIMTLFPGDLICTGTPSGVSKLNAGDQVEVDVSGVGTLRNEVVAAPTEAT